MGLLPKKERKKQNEKRKTERREEKKRTKGNKVVSISYLEVLHCQERGCFHVTPELLESQEMGLSRYPNFWRTATPLNRCADLESWAVCFGCVFFKAPLPEVEKGWQKTR